MLQLNKGDFPAFSLYYSLSTFFRHPSTFINIASLSFLIAWRSQGTWTSYVVEGREKAEAAGTFIAWTQKSWNISSLHAISQSNIIMPAQIQRGGERDSTS